MKFEPSSIQEIFDSLPEGDGYRHLLGSPIKNSYEQRPLMVLVHPGSLCVPSDFEVEGEVEPGEMISAVAQEVLNFEGDVCVLLGDFTDRVRPPYDEGLGLAVERCFKSGTVMLAAPWESDLEKAADEIEARLKASERTDVVVTGAWADADDGCAACVAQRLLHTHGAQVRMSEDAIAYDGEDAKWQADIVPTKKAV